MSVLTEEVQLDSSHRCDRCGAQAYVRTEMSSGFELLWCGHHWKEHAPRLVDQAVKVFDHSHTII